jgi:hypothetical protein
MKTNNRIGRWLQLFREWKCGHVFELSDLGKTGESEDGDRRVSWPCMKCGKVFFAHCGLDISPRHGPIAPRRSDP